jgi:hypothetical protein
VPLCHVELGHQLSHYLCMGNVVGRAPEYQLRGRRHRHPEFGKFPDLIIMVEGYTSHSLGQASGLRRADDGELIKTLLVLPLRRLMGPTLFRKLALKEDDLLRKALTIVMSRGECCRVLCLRSRYRL